MCQMVNSVQVDQIKMFSPVLIALFCYVSGVLSGMLGPCKKKDSECLQKSIGEVFPIVFGGIPSRGVDSSDPFFEKYIEGNLSILKYKFINTTITGYKDCTVINAKFDVDALKLYFEMDCKTVKMTGDYELSGKLVIIPVEGKGTYTMAASHYLIPVDAELKKIEGNNGKSYVIVKNFKLKPKALGPMEFTFNNLFNGQKDLSDAVHKFAHESYMEVAELVQDPIFNTEMKSLVKNINKFLKTEPLEEIFID